MDVKKLGKIGAKGAGHRVTRTRKERAAVRGEARHGRARASSTGWERVHVSVDDATRVAYVEVLPDEKASTAIGFLKRARCLLRLPRRSKVERLMTDNGSAYRLDRPRPCLQALLVSGICAPGPTGLRPTARQSASSARCCASGPTQPFTVARPRGRRPSRAGSSATTSGEDMAPSVTGRRLSGCVS